MARLLGHRQTKGAATDKPNLLPPRHISLYKSEARPHRAAAGQKRTIDRYQNCPVGLTPFPQNVGGEGF